MSAPPAQPRRRELERAHQDLERRAYLALIQGRITAEQYREAIAPSKRRRRGRR